jgi:inward rectifier potassium channel
VFRIAPYKNNLLSEAEAKVNLAMQLEENGKVINRFFNLDLEISKINALALSWTIVHPINEKSPLYNFNYTDMVNAKIEALVFVKAFDEVFSNTVVQRFSYIASEVVWGAKFKMMYHADEKKGATVLDLNKLNDHEKVELLSPVISP